jgi:hypothetical protein
VNELLKIPSSEWESIRQRIAATTGRADFLRMATGRQSD